MDEMEDQPLVAPFETLLEVIADCEEFGECVLYISENEYGVNEVTTVDPTTVKEVRNNLGHLAGFMQKNEGLPEVFFSKTEMMKLRVVR
jgi:hypothetical protein